MTYESAAAFAQTSGLLYFVGIFLAVPGLPPLRESLFGLLGIWLAASSAAARWCRPSTFCVTTTARPPAACSRAVSTSVSPATSPAPSTASATPR